MKRNKFFKKIVIFAIVAAMCLTAFGPLSTTGDSEKEKNILERDLINSPPTPPQNLNTVDGRTLSSTDTVILNVPTSEWTYGCTATSAGMLFGYYDRIGYSNMYTGPTNGGVCPLVDLGQATPSHSDYPNPGSCYIIATEKGLD